MKHRSFVIANEEMAIIAKEDGTVVTMPLPKINEEGQDREAIEIGSKDGKKTFVPGFGLSLLLRVGSDVGVKVHTGLPLDVLTKCQDILSEYSAVAQAQIQDALEERLLPKQKEQPTADEHSTGGHTND